MTDQHVVPPAQRGAPVGDADGTEDVTGHVGADAAVAAVPDQAHRHPDAYDLYAQIYALRGHPDA